jgi:hypothetical protein
MANLYKLSSEFAEFGNTLMDLADDDDGRIDPQWLAELNSMQQTLTQKLEACAFVHKNLQTEGQKFAAEAERLAKRAKSYETRADGLKDYIQVSLEKAGLERVDGAFWKFRIRANTLPRVTITDMDAVPTKFDKVQDRMVDTVAIRNAFKAGEEIPGVLVTRGQHVRIEN